MPDVPTALGALLAPIGLLAATALAITLVGAVAAAVFGPLILLVTAGALCALGIFALGLLADLVALADAVEGDDRAAHQITSANVRSIVRK